MAEAGSGSVFDAWCLPGEAGAPGPLRTIAPARAQAGEPRAATLRFPELDEAASLALLEELRVARREVLVDRPVAELIDLLGGVGARFLDDGDPLRERALELLSVTAGLSGPMVRTVVDGMATDWTAERLARTVELDLGGTAALDGFVDDGAGRRIRALGFPLSVHLSAGTVPGVSVTSLLRGLVVKSAVLLKPGRGDVALAVLFLEALADADPELARAAAVLYWPGGEGAVEETALREADLVVAYGGDRAVGEIRSRLPATTPLVAYHHRVSVGIVGREALGPEVDSTASAAAWSVALFDQRGCVSPQVFWVEEGGNASPREFARRLAGHLEALDRKLPPGIMGDGEASALSQIRGTAEVRAAAEEDVVLFSGNASPWTVIHDPDPGFEPSCLNRVVWVKPVSDAWRVPDLVAPLAPHVQGVAVAGLGSRLEDLAEALARRGVVRITSLDRAPWPPAWWHHDGSGPLRALVRWVDLEV